MLLKRGSQGEKVMVWQKFLLSKGYPVGAVDGIFGQKTADGTAMYQKSVGLTADGKVGRKTWHSAGLPVDESDYYPERPSFSAPSTSRVMELFGSFRYTRNRDRTINIDSAWTSKNITKVQIPQLIGVYGAPADGRIYFHKLGVAQLKSAFQAVEDAGLDDLIISWAGSYYPRMVRGSRSKLSNHSWGTAFDINAPENWLGRRPAPVGKKGSLLKLVPIFNAHGFYWGGHYRSRLDGMHFELTILDMYPDGQIDTFRPSSTTTEEAIATDLSPTDTPSILVEAGVGGTEIAVTEQSPAPASTPKTVKVELPKSIGFWQKIKNDIKWLVPVQIGWQGAIDQLKGLADIPILNNFSQTFWSFLVGFGVFSLLVWIVARLYHHFIKTKRNEATLHKVIDNATEQGLLVNLVDSD